ncbi:SDR family oxidoreductase [soil metagenome]
MTRPSFTETTAIVTGASRGFGRAISTTLIQRGARVIGVARDRQALDDVRAELGPSFTVVVADATDPVLAPQLIADHRPQLLVLNAGATPHAAALQDQTWATFSRNWDVDVRSAFEFPKAALETPLPPGSSVVSVSSGAARQGSPLSGGYAGAKATVSFISDYARLESERNSLGISFTSVLPKLTSATRLGSTFVDAYAAYAGVDRQAYLGQLGPVLSAVDVGLAVVDLVDQTASPASSYLLTAEGLQALA